MASTHVERWQATPNASGGDCPSQHGPLLSVSWRLSACEKNLDEAIERCQLFNLVAARADAFETYGNLFREKGQIDKANEYYQRAARAYDEAGVNLARTELIEEQALL